MNFSWQPISDDDLATFQRSMGTKVLKVGDVYWTQVRPFFFRPLLLFKEYDAESIRPPLMSNFGGCQYSVKGAASANSYLNSLFFENSPGYSIATLDNARRRQVKRAQPEYIIQPLTDVQEFKQQAYPVYLSFYERTRYSVGAKRRDPAFFEQWADALFKIPKILVLGGYRSGVLGGISLSYLADQTVVYATFFCDNVALDLYLPGLMIHAVRQAAAALPGISRVYAGNFKGLRGLDDFYRLRGASLVRQPMRLDINAGALFLLKKLRPKQYAHLLGELPANKAGPSDDPNAKSRNLKL